MSTLENLFRDRPMVCPRCKSKIETSFVLCVNCGTVISKKSTIFQEIFLSFLISSVISAVLYVLVLMRTTMFTEHWLNPFIFFVSIWALILVMFKYIQYRRQEKALMIFRSNSILQILISDGGIDVNNFESKIIAVAETLKKNGYYNLMNIYIFDRIRKILNYLKNVPSKDEINNTLAYQAQIDQNSADLEFRMLSVFYWGIPILGFIGTVLGIGASINSFGGFISGSGSSLADSGMRDALSNVAKGLAIAFDSTLIALTFAVILVPIGMYTENKVSELLGQVEEYCLNFLTPNIKFSAENVRMIAEKKNTSTNKEQV